MPKNPARFIARMRELRSFGYSQEWALRRATEEDAAGDGTPASSSAAASPPDPTIEQKREELTYEMRRSADGHGGGVRGVPGVFRQGGLSLEKMVEKLRKRPEYQHIRNVDDLVDLLHTAIFGSTNMMAHGIPPSPEQLRKELGIDPTKPWWKDSWRPK